jgi:class 3 adenylate cyclase
MDRAVSAREGLAVAALVAGLMLAAGALLPPLAIADNLVEDFAISRIVPPRPQQAGIAVIGVTEDDLAALPYRAPLDRAMLAKLVEVLRAKGVRAIGLDILVDQPTEPAKDALLRAVLTGAGAPVVQLSAGRETPMTEQQRRFHDAFLVGLRTGHGALARERLDGVIRRHFPWLDGLPSLPAALAEAVGVPIPHQPFTIAWSRPLPAVPVYSAAAVPLLPRAWLDGKIVLVGLEVPDIDRHRTPLTLGGAAMAGVEIQAQVLAQLLEGRNAPLAGPWVRAGAVVIAALAGAGLAIAGLSTLWLVGLAGLGELVLWLGAAGLAASGGLVLSPLAPGLSWLAALGTASALASVRERRARASLMQLFASHLSAPVAAEVWRLRHTFLRGGRPQPRRLMATVMFSDIESFTPVSERLTPERLVDWLEAYLEAMTEVVTDHGGLVLRFIGDGILAAFGAPIPRDDPAAIDADAVQAVNAALAMRPALDRLNQRFAAEDLPPVKIRIGMVTGPMVGCSVGARRHLEYTLLGDVVNTAARLEGLARTVEPAPGSPCRVVVAQSTWERVAGTVEGRPIGPVALKGKEQTVMAYQIIC